MLAFNMSVSRRRSLFLPWTASPGSRLATFVKIGAEFEADTDGRTGERFWVVILSAFDRAGSACFRGKIDNDLLCTDSHGLSEGDEIEFNPRHILALD